MKNSDKLRKMCQTLAEGDPLDALTEHDNVMNEIKELHKHVAELSFQPLINPWMKCKTTPDSQDDTIENLLENCQLSYDTGTVEDRGLHSDDDSDSNSDNSSLHDDDSGGDGDDGDQNGGKKRNMVKGFRLGLGSRRGGAACRSSDDEDDDTIKKKHHVHSQESQTLTPNDGAQGLPKLDAYGTSHGLHPAVKPVYSFLEPRSGASNFSGATPNNSYQSTPTSVHSGSNSSVFMNRLPTSHTWTTFIPRLSPATDSGSNTDDDSEPHFPSMPAPTLRMNTYRISSDGDLSEDSSHNDQETLEAATESEHSHYVNSSVLDSVELRQRYSSLSNRIGELSAPMYGQSDASMLNQSDLPSPHSHGEHDEEDFTYGHHLSLPVDSSHDENEIVFPVPRQFSWTTDQSDRRAPRAVMFEIDHNGTSVQFSIRAPGHEDDDPDDDMDPEDDMDLIDSDNS